SGPFIEVRNHALEFCSAAYGDSVAAPQNQIERIWLESVVDCHLEGAGLEGKIGHRLAFLSCTTSADGAAAPGGFPWGGKRGPDTSSCRRSKASSTSSWSTMPYRSNAERVFHPPMAMTVFSEMPFWRAFRANWCRSVWNVIRSPFGPLSPERST